MGNIDAILAEFRDGHHEFENGHLSGFEGFDPYDLFELWTQEAVSNREIEPNAFVLSTVNSELQPSSRILYLKDILDGSLVFYTNYQSRKGSDILQNSKVSMLFFWPQSSRQVRIEGICSKVSDSVSDAYFVSRPRGNQIGAWASNQSERLDTRETLEERVRFFNEKFPNEIPRPPHWGGYGVQPTQFEFWQGRPSRLHDRLVFSRSKETWSIQRLHP